jgi:hypothetical protein
MSGRALLVEQAVWDRWNGTAPSVEVVEVSEEDAS